MIFLLESKLSQNWQERNNELASSRTVAMLDYLEFIEQKLEKIMEDPLFNLIESGVKPTDFAREILAAVEADHKLNSSQPAVPWTVMIRLSKERYKNLSPYEHELATAISEIIRELNQHTSSSSKSAPDIRFIPDSSIENGSIRITSAPNPKLDTTHSLEAVPAADSFPQGAHIILDGEHIPLTYPIVNIGRRNDNHIQLNARNVSRIHAQIRARNRNFVIIDLGSSTGTYLNDNKIRQAILHSGDVISVGNQKLIYFENPEIVQESTTALNRVNIPGQE